LANPLDVYDKGIQACASNHQDKFKVVLSPGRLTGDDLKKMEASKFKSVTYPDLFARLKSLIGHYGTKADVKYLTYFNDFIKTIESLMSTNTENPRTTAFFREHGSDIEDIGEQYQKFKINQIEEFRRKLPDLDALKQLARAQGKNSKDLDENCFISEPWIKDFFLYHEVDCILMKSGWETSSSRWVATFRANPQSEENRVCLSRVVKKLMDDPDLKVKNDPRNGVSYTSAKNASVSDVADDVNKLLRKIISLSCAPCDVTAAS